MNSDLCLIFISGFLGSMHCLGMCGPFAAMLGTSAKGSGENLRRQLTYSAGRLTTYVFLGSLVGYGGQRLIQFAPSSVRAAGGLALMAGAFLLWEGLGQLGLIGGRHIRRGARGCLGGSVLSTLLATRSWQGNLLAGIATGFLPCGLVYAFLALAGQTGNMARGGWTMLAFGMGTIPIMVATGCSTSLVSPRLRTRLFRLAAISMLAIGILTTYRGILFLRNTASEPSGNCPFCDSGG